MNESLGEGAWAEIIDAWRASGLGQSEYCRKNKIKASAFYYWRKRLDGIKRKPRKKGLSGSGVKKEAEKKVVEFIEIPMPEVSNHKEMKQKVVRFTTSYGAVMEFPL